MASTFDPSQSDDQENQTDSLPLEQTSEKISDEQQANSQSEEINLIDDGTAEIDPTSSIHSTNMVPAEASFTEATSADIPVGATRSSVARILVKQGQIFRVQVDNEVKEVHGKSLISDISRKFERGQGLIRRRIQNRKFFERKR